MGRRRPERDRPKRIRVAAFDIRVVSLDPQNRHDHGTFDAARQEMALCGDFPTTVMECETLLHEVMHAIYWAYGIKQGDDEERTVTAMTVGLMQVWRDNPKLIDWINSVTR